MRPISRRECVLGAGALLAASPTRAQTPLSRAEFARRLASIPPNANPDQVREALGPPDDIGRPPLYSDNDRFIRWGYGTNGRKTLPTLGWAVLLDGKYLHGRSHNPASPVPQVMAESELVDMMRALHALAPDKMFDDPLALIRATNLLQPLGKAKALAVIEEYCWITDLDDTWISWVLRALFVGEPLSKQVPGTAMFGVHNVTNVAAFPRNPVYLVDDVPFCFCRFGMRTGPPFTVLWELDYFKESGVLRDRPLRPPSDPFLTYRKLQKTAAWRLAIPAKDPHWSSAYTKRAFIQVLNLCRTVVPAPLTLPGCKFKDEWVTSRHKRVLAKGLRWDPKQQLYVRKDGTFIPFQALQPNLSRS